MQDKKKKKDNANNPEETASDETLETVDECPGDQPEDEAAELTELEQLQNDYSALNDKHLRLMAEYDNFRKRSVKEKDDIYPAATVAALQKILPILDSLDRAAQFEYNTEDFAKGFDMIVQNLKDTLSGLGVEEVGTVGEAFDPNLHNAAMHIEDESLGQNVVSQVFQKGYRMGDRIIRYAMVQTAN